MGQKNTVKKSIINAGRDVVIGDYTTNPFLVNIIVPIILALALVAYLFITNKNKVSPKIHLLNNLAIGFSYLQSPSQKQKNSILKKLTLPSKVDFTNNQKKYIITAQKILCNGIKQKTISFSTAQLFIPGAKKAISNVLVAIQADRKLIDCTNNDAQFIYNKLISQAEVKLFNDTFNKYNDDINKLAKDNELFFEFTLCIYVLSKWEGVITPDQLSYCLAILNIGNEKLSQKEALATHKSVLECSKAVINNDKIRFKVEIRNAVQNLNALRLQLQIDQYKFQNILSNSVNNETQQAFNSIFQLFNESR